MRFIRLLITVAAISAVYFAQYIFQYQSLQEFFPQRLLDWFPSLYRITRWLPEDLWRIALWVSAAATVGIGLVAPTWPEASRATGAVLALGQRRLWLNRLLLLCAFGLATGLGLFLALGGKEGLWLRLAWASGVLFYWVGASFGRYQVTADTPEVRSSATPEQSWRVLLVVLVVAGLLFNWPFRTVVPPLPDEIVEMGLAALGYGAGSDFFANTQTAYSGFTLFPFALAMQASGDGLLAGRLLGGIAALATVLGTWLVGCELFRRSPMVGPYGELVEDDGRWPALAASALVAANGVVFHFSRLPVYLEPVAWGLLGFWLWLRSLRTGERWSLALSGILIGLAAVLYQSGLLFLLIMPFWWLGIRLFQPQWLRSTTQLGEGLRTARHSFLWWGGLWVTLAPLIGVWARTPTLLLERVRSDWLPDFSRLASALNLPIDPAMVAGQPNTGLNWLVAPLLLLAIGCLLLNLDRLVGWLLVTWFGCGLVVGMVMSTPALLWPTLVPVVPVLALVVAFTLDRLRSTLLEGAGTWAAQAATYLTIGLILWAGLTSWLDYNRFVRTTITPEHYVGFALRRLNPQTQTIAFIQLEEQAALWQTPLVRFLTNDKLAAAPVTRYSRVELPATLSPATVLVWPASAEDDLLGELRSRYPGGFLRTRRDQIANPIVYFYELP